ncbi:MAG: Fe(3+) ABC transporter substrate-binding protein [Burkholderiales bacterium]|nr:Fe(3+) ABC transporter substrate-binding protein [Burkholderiales bacterium]
MKTILSLLLATCVGVAWAQDKSLNVYSSRHYQSDEALYAGFTQQTGIRVNRIEAKEDALIERIRNEGAHSPADVLITTDAGRLWRAQQLGLFQAVHSPTLDARIPANFRDPEGQWYGFSMRARVIVYNKTKVKPDEIATYESLAEPKWKGRICVRSATHVYNLSLMGSLIEHLGKDKAQAWAKAVKANLARDPKGGDTDQMRGVAAGECDVAIANHYYYVRLARSKKAEDREVAEKIGVVFPNQSGRGTHFNVSGAGVLKHAPHREAAVTFLEYLASDSAQRYFADGNNEWPVVAGVKVSNPELAKFGQVKPDAVNVAAFGRNQAESQKLFDAVAWR